MHFRGLLKSVPALQKLLFALFIMLFSTIIFSLIGFLLIKFYFGINVLTDANSLSDFSNPEVIKSMKLMQVLSGELGLFIVPAFACAYFFEENISNYLQLKRLSPFIVLICVLLISFTSMPVINWMVEINNRISFPPSLSSLEQWMKNSEEEASRLTEIFLKGNSVTDLLSNIFIIALLPAVGEELFFRGVLQKIFLHMTRNKHVAVIITSIIFSAIHFQFYGFLPRMMLGIFLGYLLLWSGSLWLPIVAHFINNAGAVMLSFLDQHHKLNFDPDTVGTASNEKLLIATSLLLTSGLIFLIYRREKLQVSKS